MKVFHRILSVSFNLLKEKYAAIRDMNHLIGQDLGDRDADEESLFDEMNGGNKYYEKYQKLTAKVKQFYDKNNKMQEDDFISASEDAVGARGNKTPIRVSRSTHIA